MNTLNGLDKLCITFFVIATLYMCNLYYNEKKVDESSKYQEIIIISDTSFIRCINGINYIVSTHKFDAASSIPVMGVDGKFTKCAIKEFSYLDTQIPANKNKHFVRIVE